MTEKFEALWTEKAQDDLENIINYIAKENPENARNISKSIEKKSQHLTILPLQGRKVPELQKTTLNHYREIIEQKWRILYFIDKTTVYIVSIIDSRRNTEKIFNIN